MIEIHEIERRRLAGESMRAMAEEFGVTHQTLQYHRKRAGYAPLKTYRSGSAHACWRGGRFMDRHGYTMVLAPERGGANKYVPEHVLVAESVIGRRLAPGEVVHHVNGRRQDNRPENLHVCTRSVHNAIHKQLEQVAYDLMERGDITFQDGSYRLT